MYFSLGVSITLTIFAAALWGSWGIVTKYLDDYPVAGLTFWLYLFSFLLVWAVTLILSPILLTEGIFAVTREHLGIVFRILISGGIMSLGMYCSLVVVHSVGLILTTVVSTGLGTVLGLVISVMTEGMPEKDGVLTLLILTTAIFIIASLLSSYASVCRDRDRGVKDSGSALSWRMLGLLLLSAILTNGWSMGTATGTAASFPPVLTCAYMATGSFLSIAVLCGIQFTRKRQWRTVFCIGRSKRPLALGLGAAFCHYGGNLISIYSMPAISATISFVLGKSSSLWSILWGMAYREFSGVSRKTKGLLAVTILLFILGTVTLAGFQFA